MVERRGAGETEKEKEVFMKWQMQGRNETNEVYKNVERKANPAEAKAKNEKHKEWYDKMGTEEGEWMIYKVAKQREDILWK